MIPSQRLGEGACQCTGTFDKHRAWDGNNRICLEPRDVGLVLNSRGCYGNKPMTDEQKVARGWVA